MSAAEKLKALDEAIRQGEGEKLAQDMELALEVLPQIGAVVEVAEYLAPAFEITVDTHYRGLHLRDALAALDEKLASDR